MNIIYFDKLDSTNTYAKQNIETLADKTVVSANLQTQGRGRFTRTWVDLGPENIYMSIILKPSESFLPVYSNLTQYLSVCLCKQLEEMGLSPQIRWPNDVLLNGKKVCGILAETVTKSGVLKGIVLGIGVNLNASADETEAIDRPATSVNLELGQVVDKKEFMQKLIDNFFANYDEFLGNGFVWIKQDYEKLAWLFFQAPYLLEGMSSASLSPSPLEGEGWGGGPKKISRLYTQLSLEYAKELRKKMTDAENLLWHYLKKRQIGGVKFRKQSPIGKYIVDFVCFEKNLIIELDGGQHLENQNIEHDKRRDEFLEKSGYTVLRFFNTDIFKNIEGVLECVYDNVIPPTPNPPPQGGRESAKTPTPNPPPQGGRESAKISTDKLQKYPTPSIKVAIFDKIKEGRFKGFDNDGALILLTSDGKVEKINMGEII